MWGLGPRFAKPIRVRRQVQGRRFVSQVKAVNVEIQVVLGRSTLPMQQLLRMGRGAVIQLDTQEDDQVWILANNHPIARGELVIEGDRISVNITRSAQVEDYFATEQ